MSVFVKALVTFTYRNRNGVEVKVYKHKGCALNKFRTAVARMKGAGTLSTHTQISLILLNDDFTWHQVVEGQP